MYRLTTPTHIFELDLDPREWVSFFITYQQGGKDILELTEADISRMTMEESGDYYVLSYKLTQEETSLFAPTRLAQVQIRCKLADGTVLASEVADFQITDVFNKEIFE